MSQSKPKISSLFLLWRFPSRPSGLGDSKCSDWNSLFGSCTGIMRKNPDNSMNHYNHSIFMTNDSMFLISCWLSNFWLFESLWWFWCISKASFCCIVKGIHKKDPLENMILVTACMITSTYFHAFPPSKTLFGRPEATLRQASFQGLKSVSFHNVWASSKRQIYNYACIA